MKIILKKDIINTIAGYDVPDKVPRKKKKILKKLLKIRVEEALITLMDQLDRKEIKLEEIFNEDKNQQIKEFINNAKTTNL